MGGEKAGCPQRMPRRWVEVRGVRPQMDLVLASSE